MDRSLETETCDAVHLGPNDQAFLTWRSPGILVPSQKTLGELVNVLLRSLGGHRRSPVEDRVSLRVEGILNGNHDARVAAQISRLDSPLRGVEEHFVPVNVHPNHGHLRAAVLIARYHMALGPERKQLLDCVGKFNRHVHPHGINYPGLPGSLPHSLEVSIAIFGRLQILRLLA